MSAGELLSEIALFICLAALLAVAPVLILAAATRLVNGLQDARLPWTPRIELAAFGVGVAGGAIVLANNIALATIAPDQVFRVGGPWDLTFAEFLATRANPLAYDLSMVWPVPFSGMLPSVAGLIVLLLAGVVIYAPIIRFRSRRGFANGIRNAVLVFGGAYLTVYSFAYVLWLTNKLNFWIFLVLLVAIYLHRRLRPIVVKLN